MDQPRSTTFEGMREMARQRSLERIRQMIERDADVDDISLEVENHAVSFRDIYSGRVKRSLS